MNRAAISENSAGMFGEVSLIDELGGSQLILVEILPRVQR
jgi:hypothetical protein